MKQPADHLGRQRLLEDLDTTFVVEAAAGTGKTTVLVDRVVRVVKSGRARLEQVISVTFTEKAAGEMKLRLRDKLEREREASDGEARERLTRALEELEVARIGTIHGVCADLLREYPVEAEVDPLFAVAAGGDQEALLDEAFARHFQALLTDPPVGVRRMLRRKPRGRDGDSPRRLLRQAVSALVEHRDFQAPWHADPFDREAAIDALVPRLEAFGAREHQVKLRNRDSSQFLDSVHESARFVADLKHRESVAARDYDGLEAQLRELGDSHYTWTDKGWGLSFSGGATEAQVVAERDAVWATLRDFLERADADLAARLHAELQPVVVAYEREKARQGVLDFVDLLLKTRDLLQRHATVRASLQGRFTRLFVDEFQDTDPLQSEIVLLLASDDAKRAAPFETRPVPGKLFVVGDPKQSIYRFRRADILLYQRVKAHLLSHGAEVVYLSTSFRSTPGIQAAVNGAFGAAMVGEHQATWVPLDAWREPTPEQPSVIALPAPRPFGPRGKPLKAAVEAHLPEAVAGFIEWLVTKSGWTVDEDGQRVPVQARHVCLLFKRLRRWPNGDVPRPYAQALEARRVPHVLVGGRSFHAREEVSALRTALAAVERPDDELSVYATLRGPFFAFTDEALLAFKHALGKLHPLRPFEAEAVPDGAAPVVEALAVLKVLHFERNRRPVAATLHELLERTRAQAGVAFWTAGAQALANVLQLAELSRGHEKRATSFRDVVEALQREADDGEAAEAPLIEEGTEGVRMMTVHAAKGLEFPVVILAEPTAAAARQEPSHWVDAERGLWVHQLAGCVPQALRERAQEVRQRDAEEALRLTYVAATRARDLLVVPVSSERRYDDAWLEVLSPSLFPARATAHAPKAAPGCPAFGADPILDREAPVPDQVPLPGLHLAETKKNRVVWWDPNRLELQREERPGLEAADALEDDPVTAPQSRAAFEAWQLARTDAQARGAVPGVRVTVARELPRESLAGVVPLVETGVERVGRPAGRRFGELVHACLELVPLDAAGPEVSRVVALAGRALGASDEEQSAAEGAVAAALAHPLLVAARASPDVRREAAIVDHLPDGTVIEGAVDLAYAEAGGGWVVVEFKTDASLEESLPAYEAQTLAYVRAIAAATGRAARGVILHV